MATKKQLEKEKKILRESLEDATKRGETEEVLRLLDAGMEVDTKCLVSRTPLHLAAEHGHADLVEALLARGANPGALDYQNATPLHRAFATTEDLVRIVDMLIEAGAPVNARESHSEIALHMICEAPTIPAPVAVQVVERLLAAGSEVNPPDGGRMPLWYAATYGSLEVVKALIKGGADPRLGWGPETPAEVALQEGHPETAEYLKSVGG